MTNRCHLAWWNVGNLFDVEDSPDRLAWLQEKLKPELSRWTAAILDRKLTQLATIIQRMNGGKGPDILGVCEVENKRVLDLLVAKLAGLKRNYGIIHHDSSDERGIDIAFIYDQKLFSWSDLFSHVVLKRNASRDILQVTFKILRSGLEFIGIGNHWPARSGGVYETEPYRIVAAETLSYWIERIPIHKGDIPIIVMGDFNDNPFDHSIMDYALATNNLDIEREASYE